MCILVDLTDKKEATVYKVVAKKDGKYYSSFTGEEFKVGEVKPFQGIANRLAAYWNSSLDYHSFAGQSFYRENYNGKTGGFVTYNDAYHLLTTIINHQKSFHVGGKFVIVEVILGGVIWNARFDGDFVYASDTVLKIEEMDTKEK